MPSKRESLLEYLKTLLAGITVANGYNNTVVTVERGGRGIRDLSEDKMPALFIVMPHEKRQNRTQVHYSGDLQVQIVGYVGNTKGDFNGTGTGVQLDLDKFISDVTKAIETDRSQGQRVYATEITDVLTDEGDLAPNAGMVMTVVFSYVTEGVTP